MDRRIILVGILALMCLFTTGCWVYGQGQTYGYVTTVEDGGPFELGWWHAWVRADLASSNTDCYVIKPELSQELGQMAAAHQRLKLTFKRHMQTAGCSNDEIVAWEPVI